MIVVDSSFFLTSVFADEENDQVNQVFDAIQRGELDALAPALFFYEIHNSLINATRRKRIKKSLVGEYLELFALAPITVVDSGAPEAILKLTLTHDLTFYDASYLELAKRRNIPLATLDAKLHNAAEKENLAYR